MLTNINIRNGCIPKKNFTKFLGGPPRDLIVLGPLALRLKVHTVRYATAFIPLSRNIFVAIYKRFQSTLVLKDIKAFSILF